MATYTDNLNLKKPSLTDPASIGDINGNMDIIDNTFGTAFSFGTKSISGHSFTANQYRKIEGITIPQKEGYRCFVLSVSSISHSAIRVFNYLVNASSGTIFIEAVNTSSSSISGVSFNISFLYIKDSMFAEA